MTPAIGEAIGRCYQALIDAAESAYKEGHRKGRSLLMALNTGSATANTFNEQALRVDR